jgi:uncharacterized protein (TIGR00730 family)
MKQDEVGIAVFGSSEPAPGEPLYERARELGRLLAEAGFRVVSGGYGGVMEAASRGAREANGATLGVTCAIFDWRRPNEHLGEVMETADLFERTRGLVERSRGFVILPGKAGTLAELAFLWALHRAGCLTGRPVLLLGAQWKRVLSHLSDEGILGQAQLEMSRIVETPREAVESLRRDPGLS